MADFETDVELSLSVPSRELRDARAAIESEFEDIAVGVDAGIGRRGGMGGGGVSSEEQRRRRRQIRLAQRRTDDIERIVEILEDIEENTADIGGGGDDGLLERLPRIGLTGALGVGVLGAGALGSALGGLSSVLDRVPERIGVEDPSPLGIEDPTPLPIADPDPLPVEEIEEIPVEDPGTVTVEYVVETVTGMGTPSPTPEQAARDQRVMREDQQASRRLGGSGDPFAGEAPTPTPTDGSELDPAEPAAKGIAGGIIGAIGARLAEGGRILGGAARGVGGPSPGGIPIPAPTIPFGVEIGERAGIIPDGPRGTSLQTISPTQTQPQITVNVGDIQSDVQADVAGAVDEAIQQVEQDRDRQIEELRNTIDRQVRNLQRDIQRGTSTGIR